MTLNNTNISLTPTNTNTTPLRVMHILHTLNTGGAEVLVNQLIRARHQQHQFSVVALDNTGPLKKDLRQLHIPVHCCKRQPGLDFACAKRIARLAKRHNIDVIHAHQYTPFVYAAMARFFSSHKPRLIFTEHGRHYPDQRKLKRVLANKLFFQRQASAFTAVGKFIKDALHNNEALNSESIRVIHNGINPEPFSLQNNTTREQLRKQLNITPEQTVLMLVGGFRSVKDHHTALKTLRQLKLMNQNVVLVCVGDGPTRQEIEAQAETLRLTPHLRFTGVRRDIPELLQAADIALCTSLSEGISISLLEAMAAGKPVVATNVGGNAEVVQHYQTGILAPRQDHLALGNAIIELINKPDLVEQFSQSARKRVWEQFHETRMHQQWIDLYQQVSGVAA